MKRYISLLILVSSILVIFFLPFGVHIDLGPGPNSLISMIWEIPSETAWYTIRFFSAFRYYFIYCFFRVFFLIEIILLFISRYNKIRFILIGIISEVIPLVLSIPALYILNSQGDNLLPIIFPIPILLFYDLFLALILSKKVNSNNFKNK
ncbi:MAG: hypothetical protein EU531_03640 [Promethearchaeota archaeon]|nr:MAG: hypothetical protein EU531_03640 [Candidatus Lokiarchaeota archaeon]